MPTDADIVWEMACNWNAVARPPWTTLAASAAKWPCQEPRIVACIMAVIQILAVANTYQHQLPLGSGACGIHTHQAARSFMLLHQPHQQASLLTQ